MTAGRKTVSIQKAWCNPEGYVASITQFLGRIDLDPCWNSASSVVADTCYTLPEVDGLRASWEFRRIYVNPPYGYDVVRRTHIRDWLARCSSAHRDHRSEVVALVPVATNTRHWNDHVFGTASAACFLREPRVKFSGSPKGAPMACAFVYWGRDVPRFRHVFRGLGFIVDLVEMRELMIDRPARAREIPR